MYKLRVAENRKKSGWIYIISLNDDIITWGYRPDESRARHAGHEDLHLCIAFQIGKER